MIEHHMSINRHRKKGADSFKICHCAMNLQHFFKPAMCYEHMQSAPLMATSTKWTKVKVAKTQNGYSSPMDSELEVTFFSRNVQELF